MLLEKLVTSKDTFYFSLQPMNFVCSPTSQVHVDNFLQGSFPHFLLEHQEVIATACVICIFCPALQVFMYITFLT